MFKEWIKWGQYFRLSGWGREGQGLRRTWCQAQQTSGKQCLQHLRSCTIQSELSIEAFFMLSFYPTRSLAGTNSSDFTLDYNLWHRKVQVQTGLLVCDVYSGWAGPCHIMKPIITKLKSKVLFFQKYILHISGLIAIRLWHLSWLSMYDNPHNLDWFFLWSVGYAARERFSAGESNQADKSHI